VGEVKGRFFLLLLSESVIFPAIISLRLNSELCLLLVFGEYADLEVLKALTREKFDDEDAIQSVSDDAMSFEVCACVPVCACVLCGRCHMQPCVLEHMTSKCHVFIL